MPHRPKLGKTRGRVSCLKLPQCGPGRKSARLICLRSSWRPDILGATPRGTRGGGPRFLSQPPPALAWPAALCSRRPGFPERGSGRFWTNRGSDRLPGFPGHSIVPRRRRAPSRRGLAPPDGPSQSVLDQHNLLIESGFKNVVCMTLYNEPFELLRNSLSSLLVSIGAQRTGAPAGDEILRRHHSRRAQSRRCGNIAFFRARRNDRHGALVFGARRDRSSLTPAH